MNKDFLDQFNSRIDETKKYFDEYVDVYENVPKLIQTLPNNLGYPLLLEEFQGLILVITSSGYLELYQKEYSHLPFNLQLVDFTMLLNAPPDDNNPILVDVADINEDTPMSKSFVFSLRIQLLAILKINFHTIAGKIGTHIDEYINNREIKSRYQNHNGVITNLEIVNTKESVFDIFFYLFRNLILYMVHLLQKKIMIYIVLIFH